jgi:4-oxalocrotonate tautomerase
MPQSKLRAALGIAAAHLDPHTQERPMPTYHVEMIEGRTLEQKKRLVQEITRVSVEVLGGSPDSVDVLITDVKAENWATGGKLWSEPRG